jgi:two-component system response regulator HupR/HoxA
MTRKQPMNTVLFVDDEPHIISAIRRATSEEPYRSLFAGSGCEALQAFVEHDVHVIVTDMRMPGMDGLTLLKAVREKKPETVRIVLSGYTQLSQVLATVNQAEIFQYIAKPWQMDEELLVTVRRAIETYNLKTERVILQEGLAKKNAAYIKIFQATEQILANQKRDLANLKRVSEWSFALWKRQLTGNPPTEADFTIGKELVALIEEIQLRYLDSLPSASGTKTVTNIADDIAEACGGRIAISITGNENLRISGYHRFLASICKIIISVVTGIEAHTMVPCHVAVEINDLEAPALSFLYDLQPLRLTRGQKTRLVLACSLLNEIGQAYNVKVVTEVNTDDLVAVKATMFSADE